jgi:hypothetical protein
MRRLFIGVVVLCSLLFLFGGLFIVQFFGNDKTDEQPVTSTVRGYVSHPVTEKYSMKQIDSLSSKYNYAFTGANADGSSVLPKAAVN